jgi:hypothetical protein
MATPEPDKGIQTLNVQKGSLPYLDSNNQYLVRYRVRTEDGRYFTSWSNVFRVERPSMQTLTYNTDEREIKSHGKSFDVSWKFSPSIPTQIDGLPLDVYVKWDSEESWTFVSTITANSFSVPIPTQYQSSATESHTASFMVHLATFVKDRLPTDTDTLVLTANDISTRAKYDAGSIV